MSDEPEQFSVGISFEKQGTLVFFCPSCRRQTILLASMEIKPPGNIELRCAEHEPPLLFLRMTIAVGALESLVQKVMASVPKWKG